MGERQERFRQKIEQLSPRPLSGMCWRQTSPRYALSSLPPSGSGGRYDRAGGPPVLYAAETRDGAWAELYRHHSGTGVDVSLMKRRFGAIHVNSLDVLDLADSNVRKAIGVFDDDLIAEDYELCQDLADAAREAGGGQGASPSGITGAHAFRHPLSARAHVPPGRRTVDMAATAAGRRVRAASPPLMLRSPAGSRHGASVGISLHTEYRG